MRNLIDIVDLTTEEIDSLIEAANDIIADGDKYCEKCKRKKLATLFFEPSTRTRLSFEAAMLELGGSVLGFSEAASSSASKGESVGDTVKVVSCYADIIAMRHPKEGAPMVASLKSDVPIINSEGYFYDYNPEDKHYGGCLYDYRIYRSGHSRQFKRQLCFKRGYRQNYAHHRKQHKFRHQRISEPD